jgi:hypothetical protein
MTTPAALAVAVTIFAALVHRVWRHQREHTRRIRAYRALSPTTTRERSSR